MLVHERAGTAKELQGTAKELQDTVKVLQRYPKGPVNALKKHAYCCTDIRWNSPPHVPIF